MRRILKTCLSGDKRSRGVDSRGYYYTRTTHYFRALVAVATAVLVFDAVYLLWLRPPFPHATDWPMLLRVSSLTHLAENALACGCVFMYLALSRSHDLCARHLGRLCLLTAAACMTYSIIATVSPLAIRAALKAPASSLWTLDRVLLIDRIGRLAALTLGLIVIWTVIIRLRQSRQLVRWRYLALLLLLLALLHICLVGSAVRVLRCWHEISEHMPALLIATVDTAFASSDSAAGVRSAILALATSLCLCTTCDLSWHPDFCRLCGYVNARVDWERCAECGERRNRAHKGL